MKFSLQPSTQPPTQNRHSPIFCNHRAKEIASAKNRLLFRLGVPLKGYFPVFSLHYLFISCYTFSSLAQLNTFSGFFPLFPLCSHVGYSFYVLCINNIKKKNYCSFVASYNIFPSALSLIVKYLEFSTYIVGTPFLSLRCPCTSI